MQAQLRGLFDYRLAGDQTVPGLMFGRRVINITLRIGYRSDL